MRLRIAEINQHPIAHVLGDKAVKPTHRLSDGAVVVPDQFAQILRVMAAAGLIFGKLYFPNEDPLTATLAAFGTYFIGFVGRPIGAAIFGHYGDRIGRKAALIATLLGMGIAPFLVAFVPTYESIGIWGAVILTVLRTLQGIGVGGEWGGSVLLAMEWSRSHGSRGLGAFWPQFGGPSGLFLSILAILGCSALTGPDFATWGWRVPFALSIILIGIGL